MVGPCSLPRIDQNFTESPEEEFLGLECSKETAEACFKVAFGNRSVGVGASGIVTLVVCVLLTSADVPRSRERTPTRAFYESTEGKVGMETNTGYPVKPRVAPLEILDAVVVVDGDHR